MGRGRRRGKEPLARSLGRCEAAGKKTDGCRLDVTLATGDLAGEAQPRLDTQSQRGIKELRRIDEGVAVKAAKTRELGCFKRGNGAKDADLLAVLELRLEAHHVEQGAEPVVLAKLDDRIGLPSARVRIGQSERFHRHGAH